ncbi:MAG: phytoene/squalene synthase family protein [Chloroflexi bacterium]|nr:phytoene/squalene synthase family protein [Chloroflexota bacterium]
MTVQLQQYAWETTLLDWAHHARASHVPSERVRADSDMLEAAYHHCEAITNIHSRTFFLASALLPPEKRRAARALYAFCRVTDDLVDRAAGSQAETLAELEAWRERALDPHPPADQPVALAWADARARYGIPVGYAEQLIDGVARDLTFKRYRTFDELAAYSYGVASTVGLMAMHIIGYGGEQALPYAVKLGVALQVTNILRDVAEDYRAGRVYLPAEELEHFDLTDADLQHGRVDQRWRAFMRFQIERNRRLYAEALPGIAALQSEGRFAIAAAAELYRAILTDIEANDYDVFSRRAHISTKGKVARLPKIWWRSRTVTLD